MVTLFGILNVGARGLFAAQSALDTTGHNIANASTEGYTRQRVVQSASAPIQTSDGIYGTGVDIVTVERIRDVFLDGQVRMAKSGAGYYEQQENLFLRLEAILNDTLTPVSDSAEQSSSGGLNSLISSFYSAWHELANSPEAPEVRSAVLESGRTLADTLNLISEQLNQTKTDLNNKASDYVDEINSIAKKIASLNTSISVAEVGGGFQANDLRDERDAQIDRLSEIVPITVIPTGEEQVAITINGVRLVDGVETNLLRTRLSERIPVEVDNIYFERQGLQSLDRVLDSGSLGGIVDARDRIIPQLSEEIDNLARSIIQEVNRIHCGAAGTAGYSELTSDFDFPSGSTDVNSETTLDRIFNNPSLEPDAPRSAEPFGVQDGRFIMRVATEDNVTRGTFDVNVSTSDSIKDIVERIDRADGVVSQVHSALQMDAVYVPDVRSGMSFEPNDVLSSKAPLQLSALFPNVPVGFDAGAFQMEIHLRDAAGNAVDADETTAAYDPFTVTINATDTLSDVAGRIASETDGAVSAEFVPDPNDSTKVKFRLRATGLGETFSVQGDTSGIIRAMSLPLTDPTTKLVGGAETRATGYFAAGKQDTQLITAGTPNFSGVFPGPPPSVIGEGSFDVVVVGARGEVRETRTITIKDGGVETISDVATQINAMADLTATVSGTNGQLTVEAGDDRRFFFRNDTTGLVEALGLDDISGYGEVGDLPFQSGTFEVVVADSRGKVTDIFNVDVAADPVTSAMSLSDIVDAINDAANEVGAPVIASLVSDPKANPKEGENANYVLKVEATGGHQFTFRSDDTLLLSALGFSEGPLLEQNGDNPITGASGVTRVGDNIGPTVNADLNINGDIVITSTGTDEISFLDDTSYFLASSGLNTFFQGGDAGSIRVNDDLNEDLRLLAASKSGQEGDNQAALAIAELHDRSVIDSGSHGDYYRSIISRLGIEGAKINQFSEVNQKLLREFTNLKEQISGVSLDEESINLIRFQQAFQGAARLITTLDELISIVLGMGA